MKGRGCVLMLLIKLSKEQRRDQVTKKRSSDAPRVCLGYTAPRPIMRLAAASLALCCSALAFQAAPLHVSASLTPTRSVSSPIVAREGDKDGMSGAVGGAVLGGLLAGP